MATPLDADLKAVSLGILDLLDEQTKELQAARTHEIETQIKFERDQEDFSKYVRDRRMELANDPRFQDQRDPRTGKVNQEWTGWLIDQALEKDADVVLKMASLFSVQGAYFEAKNNSMAAAERIGTTKTKAALMAALLRYASSSV